MTEVRGSSLECQAVTAQEWRRGATVHPRSGAAGRRHHVSEVRAAAGRRNPASEVRGGREKPPRT